MQSYGVAKECWELIYCRPWGFLYLITGCRRAGCWNAASSGWCPSWSGCSGSAMRTRRWGPAARSAPSVAASAPLFLACVEDCGGRLLPCACLLQCPCAAILSNANASSNAMRKSKQDAAAQLRTEMASAVDATCEQIGAELAAAASGGGGGGGGQRPAARSPLQLQQLQVRDRAAFCACGFRCHPCQLRTMQTGHTPLAHMPLNHTHHTQLVLHLVTSPFFRPTTVTPRLIAHLASFLRAAVAPSSGAAAGSGTPGGGSGTPNGGGGGGGAGLGEFKSTLMHVLEAISQVGACGVCCGFIFAKTCMCQPSARSTLVLPGKLSHVPLAPSQRPPSCAQRCLLGTPAARLLRRRLPPPPHNV